MSSSLLDLVVTAKEAFVATVIATEGHTYKKTGAKALYVAGDPLPLCGNLGSLCVDQDIARVGEKALRERKPALVTIDTRDKNDIHLGYSAYCGGSMKILIEPLLDEHRRAYGLLRERLAEGRAVFLVHDLAGGELAVERERPRESERLFVEEIRPPRKLFLFGATPLAREIVSLVDSLDFDVHVVDWREEYIKKFESAARVTRRLGVCLPEEGSFMLILSHAFERDKDALKQALGAGCAYVGLLSSRTRRDEMSRQLLQEGVSAEEWRRVASPAGLDIGARTDAEIAVSIVAELVKCRNA